MDIAISCTSVSKRFHIPVHQHHTLRGRILHPFDRATHRDYDAVDDVSFDVHEGEFFGIVGRNGSGKSTLLKMLAGIYRPDSGSIDVRGSVAPFIELGVGFNFELSARDNVFLNGALLGLSRRQLEERYEHIVQFAELEEFMDLKLANFSSGMQVRLAFAIAVESHAEILMIDEVLAVGDERFQRKCFQVFRERRRLGQTVVFVSHDMAAIREFCDRVLLLERGVALELGDARTVAQTYFRLNMPEDDAIEERAEARGWIHDVSLVPCVTRDDIVVVEHGAQLDLVMRVAPERDVERPAFGFVVTDHKGMPIIATSTNFDSRDEAPLVAGKQVDVSFSFQNVLGAGGYMVMATVDDRDSNEPVAVRREALEFVVDSRAPTGAYVELPHVFSRSDVREASASVHHDE